MIRYCALAGFALAVSVSAASAAAPAPAKPKVNLKPNNLNINKVNNQNGHAHHLQQALRDLEAAEAAIRGQNLKQAHKDVAAAIHQIEEAIHHHHKHHIATQSQPNGNGLSNSFNHAKHHHHHSLLQRVVSELRVAEKELKAGAAAQASREIEKAEKTLQTAIASHKQLPK